MDMDQIKGKLQNAFGKAEELVGEAVGSKDLANAGSEDRVKGAATETWGNAKDAVHSVGETSRTETTVHADSTRDSIASGAERLRDSINAKLDNAKDHQEARRDTL